LALQTLLSVVFRTSWLNLDSEGVIDKILSMARCPSWRQQIESFTGPYYIFCPYGPQELWE